MVPPAHEGKLGLALFTLVRVGVPLLRHGQRDFQVTAGGIRHCGCGNHRQRAGSGQVRWRGTVGTGSVVTTFRASTGWRCLCQRHGEQPSVDGGALAGPLSQLRFNAAGGHVRTRKHARQHAACTTNQGVACTRTWILKRKRSHQWWGRRWRGPPRWARCAGL